MRNGRLYALRTSDTDTAANGSSFWPTPRALSGGPNSNRANRSSAGGPDLQEAAQNWPTPDANTSSYSGDGNGPNLREAAANWPTPVASDFKGSARPGQKKGQLAEATEQLWSTPIAHDMRGERGAGQTTASNGAGNGCLARESREWLQDLKNSTPGAPCSSAGRGSRPRLNPLFVEWLMGFPFRWTDEGGRA